MRAAKMTALIGLSAQLFLLGPSSAADYPSRPIKLLVGASAGGTTAAVEFVRGAGSGRESARCWRQYRRGNSRTIGARRIRCW
jgi:hypothetical protein